MIVQFFEIPLPVSANRMWRHGRGRTYLSTEYRAFIRALGWHCQMQGVVPQPSPLRFTLIIRGGKGWRVNADIDNRIKPTLDALARNRIILDDSTKNVPQQELVYVTRPSRGAVVRCFVRLAGIDPAWSGWVPPPSPPQGEEDHDH